CACAACEPKVASKMPSSAAKTPARPRPANILRGTARRAVLGLSARAQTATNALTTLHTPPPSESAPVLSSRTPVLYEKPDRRPANVPNISVVLFFSCIKGNPRGAFEHLKKVP